MDPDLACAGAQRWEAQRLHAQRLVSKSSLQPVSSQHDTRVTESFAVAQGSHEGDIKECASQQSYQSLALVHSQLAAKHSELALKYMNQCNEKK